MMPFIDCSNFENIKKVISYGLSLINKYTEWDKSNLPNPEIFPEEDEYRIGVINYSFSCAISYILAHEFSHAKFGHTGIDCKLSELAAEIEAEENALKMIIRGIPENNEEVKFNISIGTIAGICSLFFFNSTLDNPNHPDCDARVKKYFELLNIDEDDILWSIPCIAYQLWDIAYGKNLNFPNDEKNYKDLFLDLQEQEWGLR